MDETTHASPAQDRGRILPRAAIALLLLAAGAAAAAPQETETDRAIAEIRQQILDLRREYDGRLAALERRLESLESGRAEAAPTPQAGDELARLRDAARAAAGGRDAETEVAVETPISGRERNLNRLNPEISLTGIVLGNAASDDREEFEPQEFELDLQAALDPFSRTRFTLAVGEEGVEVEEGYVLYSSLPGGLELMAGKFRQRFGPLNRQHLHALPQSDYPLALATFFGDEGLAQTGLSFTWLLPRPWATANEITLEITDGENEEAFGGEEFEDFAALARIKNFWELSAATWLEWGLTGIAGKTAADGDSRVYGTDLTLHWQPPARAKYRELTWRTEALRSEREDELGVEHEALGLYTYLEGLLARNLYAGLRYDFVEDPLDPERDFEGFVPYLTWWQSEFVRLRAEYGVLEDSLTGRSEDRFTLQLTWAAGPHKHETY